LAGRVSVYRALAEAADDYSRRRTHSVTAAHRDEPSSSSLAKVAPITGHIDAEQTVGPGAHDQLKIRDRLPANGVMHRPTGRLSVADVGISPKRPRSVRLQNQDTKTTSREEGKKMPGFDDSEAIAVYPTNSGDNFRVPTVEAANGFDVHLEAEAGNGVIGPGSNTPYTASIQIRNLTQFALVTAAAPTNAAGNIGVGQDWVTNDEEFIFTVAGGAANVNPGDFLEVVGLVRAGNPAGAATNDFSFVQSEIFQVI
jgi:hypothetical protein